MANKRVSAFSVYSQNQNETNVIQKSEKLNKMKSNSFINSKNETNEQMMIDYHNNNSKKNNKASKKKDTNNYSEITSKKLKSIEKKQHKKQLNKKKISNIIKHGNFVDDLTRNGFENIINKKKPKENNFKTTTSKQLTSTIVSNLSISDPSFLKAFNEKKSNKVHKESPDTEIIDSKKEALLLFQQIISPVKVKDFFNEYWEKKPLLIKRKASNYYKNWFSCKEFDNILRNNILEFTQNIDVVTYINGIKEKHNPEGRAYAPLVWDFFQQGCSIRFLNPQTYSENTWKYLSLLQELFCCSVGCNAYLTPAGTQGFAPHFDDIEAFALQLEGKKRWRVYKPRNKSETLPRFSSGNFNQDELGEPLIDCILEKGDLLYFPRGFIHQANACEDIHSLHITVSCYQNNTYGDFLVKALPAAIEIAMQEDVEFRQGLPLNFLEFGGMSFENDKKNAHLKSEFISKIVNLTVKLAKNYLPISGAIDQMGKSFIHGSLPPHFTEDEKQRSIHGAGERWNEQENRVERVSEIEPDSKIKLIRKNCIRLVAEENKYLIYHNLENTRVYQEKEQQYLEVDNDALPVITYLIQSYPKYVTVDSLPMNTIDEKITVASCLYDKGLIITEEPLTYSFEDDEESSVSENDEECDENCVHGDDNDDDDDDGDDDDEECDHECDCNDDNSEIDN